MNRYQIIFKIVLIVSFAVLFLSSYYTNRNNGIFKNSLLEKDVIISEKEAKIKELNLELINQRQKYEEIKKGKTIYVPEYINVGDYDDDCENEKDEAREEGYDEGYEKGKEDGYEDRKNEEQENYYDSDGY